MPRDARPEPLDRDRLLRALFDHTFQLIGLLDREGRLLEANRTALEFVGYTREEAIGLLFWETRWWSPADGERVRQAIAQAARGEFVRFEAQHRGIDGRTMMVDFSLSPVRDENGEVVLLIPEGRDITTHKQLERLRDDYLAFISHDLRNPVSSISLHAELLSRALATTEMTAAQQSARLIVENAKRMGAMIRELVEVARLESGRPELRLELVALPALVAGVVERTVPPAERARVRISARTLPRIACDPDRLERVVANLIGNALKYSPPGSDLAIDVGGDETEARVAVRDHGPGIALADRARIFDKFERAHAARPDSLGLGLYICRLIVEAHGGRIWVDSTVGGGASFEFALPRIETIAPQETRSAGRKLLVVEDDAAARAGLALLLADEGHTVETAGSGVEALQTLTRFDAEIVLTDVGLPGMSGIELARRARERAPRLHVLFMTGRERDSHELAALDADYVGKPVDVTELLRKIDRCR